MPVDLWNPRNPRVVGLEWPVRKSSGYTLDSLGKSYAWICRSTVTEPVLGASLFVDAQSGGNDKYGIDVYNLDDLDVAPLGFGQGSTTVDLPPVAGTNYDGLGYFDTDQQPTTAHNCFGTPETPGFGDLALDNAGGDTTEASIHWLEYTFDLSSQMVAKTLMAIQSFDLTGQRIIAVTLQARAVGVNATIYPVLAFTGTNGVGNPLAVKGAIHVGQGRGMPSYLNGQNACVSAASPDLIAPLFEWRYERNPFTNLFWTPLEVMAYMASAPRLTNADPGGNSMFGYQIQASQPTTAAVLSFRATVEYAAEDRVGSGYLDIDSPGMHTIACPFNKFAGQTLLLAAHKISDGDGSITIRSLEADTYCPLGYTTMRPQLVNRAGQIALPLPPERPDVAGILLGTSLGYSVDSQAYVASRAFPIDATHLGVQTFQIDQTGTFGYVSLVLASSRPVAPEGPLTVTVRAFADSSIVATVDISPDELDHAPQTFERIGVSVDAPFTLTAGLVYYLQISTPSGVGAGWELMVLDTLNSLGAQNAVTFGGPDGPPGGVFGYPDGQFSSLNGGEDTPFVLVQSPPVPRGFNVVKAVQA